MTENTPQPNIFLDLIVALLTPMFLAATGGNIPHARAAAIQAVNAYRAETHGDLLTVAQIIAFGLAALGSLSLAMADDLPIALTLRLRGNAVSANRAAEQCRRALAESPSYDPTPEPNEDPFPIEPILSPPPARQPPTPQPPAAQVPAAQPKPTQLTPTYTWADAMADVAAEITAGIPHLPKSERRAASIRVNALNSAASNLLNPAQVTLRPHIHPKPA
jgi:hypothetical protein